MIAFPLSFHCWCTTFIPGLFATQIFLCLWPVMSIRVKSTLLPYKSWSHLQCIINSCNPDLLFKRAPFPVSGLQSFQLRKLYHHFENDPGGNSLIPLIYQLRALFPLRPFGFCGIFITAGCSAGCTTLKGQFCSVTSGK